MILKCLVVCDNVHRHYHKPTSIQKVESTDHTNYTKYGEESFCIYLSSYKTKSNRRKYWMLVNYDIKPMDAFENQLYPLVKEYIRNKNLESLC